MYVIKIEYFHTQVLISSSRDGQEFDEVIVDKGHPVLGDIHLDHSHKFVIVSTPYKVSQ